MRRARSLPVLVATAVAALAVAGLALSGVLDRVEQQSRDARFTVRGARPAPGIAVVGIDEDTFTELRATWPLNRRLHARMIDRLTRARARLVVYDVQFTEPSAHPRADLALYDAAGRNGGVVFATGESDDRGRTRVLGGAANLASIGATAAASNFPADAGGVIRRYEARVGRLPTIAVAVASALGRRVPAGAGGRLIDFRGPPGTFPSYSFADVLRGRVPDGALRGRIVVVGATAPVLQDRHPTSTSGARTMAGPELQASAIWTALHGDPLQEAPAWAGWLAAAVALAAGPLLVLLAGPLRAVLAAAAVGAAYAVSAQLSFGAGTVLAVALPLTALAAGTGAGVVAGAVAETAERRRAIRRNDELEAAVRERTADLESAQIEIAMRLARAAELRDEDTADHVERMSRLVELVALELGLPGGQARLLRQAAVLHDVGKIGLPDGILRKPGRLTPAERATMRRHTTAGAEILAGSTSPLLQAAEVIARTHHERWDGHGYPAGLSGEAIPLAGRIAAVCDVFDALVSARPYKLAWSEAEACGEVERERGGHFDPEIADALLRVIARRPSVDAGAERDVRVGTQEDDAAVGV